MQFATRSARLLQFEVKNVFIQHRPLVLSFSDQVRTFSTLSHFRPAATGIPSANQRSANRPRYQGTESLSTRSTTTNKSSFKTKWPTYSDQVLLPVSEGKTVAVNATWLRENCPCDQCYSHSTNQRLVLFHQLAADSLSATEVTAASSDVIVTWSDGHVSKYDVSWVLDKSGAKRSSLVKKRSWNAETLRHSDVPRVNFHDLLSNAEHRKTLLESLCRWGVGFVDKAPPTLEGTMEAAGAISVPLRTLYGDRWVFGPGRESSDEFQDTAYTNLALGAHTDGTYYITPPGIQIFQCLGQQCTGGESLLVDGLLAADTLRHHDPESFNTLTRFPLDHTYLDPRNALHSTAPVLKLDPYTDELEWIRYNPYDRSSIHPFHSGTILPAEVMGDIYSALAKLASLVESPEAQFWIKLEPGTVIFIDNWRVLHGRAAFTGLRQMAGCYLGRDEWVSQARCAGAFGTRTV